MKIIVFQLMFIVRHQSHLPVSIVTTPQLPSNTIFDGVPTFDVDVWWTPARASPPFCSNAASPSQYPYQKQTAKKFVVFSAGVVSPKLNVKMKVINRNNARLMCDVGNSLEVNVSVQLRKHVIKLVYQFRMLRTQYVGIKHAYYFRIQRTRLFQFREAISKNTPEFTQKIHTA